MLARHLTPLILEALQDFPVVTITGARQVGKTTLAKEIFPSTSYFTFDEFSHMGAAKRDPDSYVDGLPTPIILDEVQRVPEILVAIKRLVDRKRKPGRFLLTGSANLLLMQEVSESLAGRVAIFELHPFSASELTGKKPPLTLIDNMFRCQTAKEFLGTLGKRAFPPAREILPDLILKGGYPTPALMKTPRSRNRWFDSYRKTYLEKDVRNISAILDIPDFGRLLTSSAFNSGQLLNYAAVSRDLGIPINTLRRHIGILETTFQISTISPYFANISKRLVKCPKWYFSDTGLAAFLLSFDSWGSLEKSEKVGPFVETWTGNELRKILPLSFSPRGIHFYRTHAGLEVDFVLSQGEEKLVPIEVKWSRNLGDSDIRPLEVFLTEFRKKTGIGIIFYSGTIPMALHSKIIALPLTILCDGL